MFRSILQGITIGFIVMTAATDAAAATRTWAGGGDGNMMSAGNWSGNVAPVGGDSLVFPSLSLSKTVNNNFPNGTKFETITFSEGYTLNGNRMVISSGIAQFHHLGATINCNLTLDGGAFATGVTIHVSQPTGNLDINGTIDSTGGIFQPALRKTGPGLLQLSGANTYGGVTAIEAGELRMKHASALGATSANTVVSDGAVLGVEVPGNPGLAEPSMLAGQGSSSATDGALTFRLAAIWAGNITLFGAATPVIAANYVGPTATISGVISGSTGLIKAGSAWLRLSGANNYTGTTFVTDAPLVVAHAQALGSPSAGTYLSSGGSLRIDVPEVLNEPLVVDTQGVSATSERGRVAVCVRTYRTRLCNRARRGAR